jgi:uncharacterized protein (TIGR02118 family)
VIKLIGTAYKRDDFSTREFFDYWRDVHAPISARSGPLRGYVASEVIRKLDNPNNPDDGNAPEIDGFVEQWWDDEETFDRAMSSENESEAWADVLNYAKPNGTFWVVKEHVYIPPPITGPGSLTNNVWIS